MSTQKKNNKKTEQPEETSKVEPENEANEEEQEEEEEEEDPYARIDQIDLPEPVLKRVKGLRKLHENYEAIDAEYKEQRIALEKQFLQRKKALFDQRSLVLTGASDITEEGVLTNEPSKDEEKGVPSFWLTTIASNSVIGTLIAEEDVPALEALTNITVDYAEDFSAFILNFHFNENDFFTNTVLKKKYAVEPDLLDERSPSLSDIEGDEIQWKKGKDLTKQEITKKQKAKGGRNKGQVRTVTRTVPKPSFFHFFDTPKQHGEEEEEEEQPEEEDEQEGGPRTKFNIDEDYDIGHIIRTSIIPEAILWFTGEAEDDEGMFDFGEEDDEDGEGGDDDEEEEEEEEEAPAKEDKKKSKKGSAGNANSGEKPPECKQN
eukprot:gene10338-11244_t